MNPDDNTSNDDVLEELIAEFLDAESQGAPIDREALLARHPDHADSLRDFFADHDRMVSAADIESPTLPQLAASEDATLAPSPATADERTLPPIPPDAQKGSEPTVGDTVRYFGDYELLEEIARGGMGVVFKARQVNLSRIVALKMILAGQFAGEEDVQRFYTEAEAAAQLDHPGIVPIFEIGEHAGQHYFSMGYIEGQSLAERITDSPLPPRNAAALVKKICDAMAYAHTRGVIHRDLKPANVLLDADGQPKVTDFGLAKKTEGDSNLTGTGQILGTPAYMPPEQASGKADEVGPLADVYALGAILYCLVTGRPPFQAASPMDTLLQVLEQEPVSPRLLNDNVSKDLETICLKCLEKNPDRRYESAQDLADELQRLLEGSPIKARPVGRTIRLWRWGNRHPWKAATAAALCCVVLLLTVGGPAVAVRETNLRFIADRASYGNRVQLAEREWKIGQVANAINALSLCPEEFRGWEWNHVSRLCHQELLHLKEHTHTVSSIAFHPDGHQFATSSLDKSVVLWDLKTAKPAHRLNHDAGVIRVAYSPDGKYLASGGKGKVVHLWDTSNGSLIRDLKGHTGLIRSVAFSTDGSKLASASYDHTAMVWDVDSGELLTTLEGHTNQVKGVSFHPTDDILATGSHDATIKLWDLNTSEEIRTLRGHDTSIVSVEFSADGSQIVSASGDQTARIWDTATGRVVSVLKGHKREVLTAQFGPDGRHILTAGGDRTLRVWDRETDELVRSYFHHHGRVEDARYSPDARWIVSTGTDGSVRVWDTADESEAIELGNNGVRVNELAFSTDGSSLFSVGGHGGVAWLTETGWWLGSPFLHRQDVYCIAIDPSGQRIATAGDDTEISLWNLETYELIRSLKRPGNSVRAMAFSPDGRFLITGNTDRSARIINIEDGETRRLDHLATVVGLAVDEPGQRLFTAAADGNLTAWDLKTGTELAKEKMAGLSAIAINNPGREIWAADQNGALMVYSIDGSMSLKRSRPVAHNSAITSLAITGDGSRVASGDSDGVLKLWDTATAQTVLSISEHSRAISSIEFSSDDRWLATGSANGFIRIRDSLQPTEERQRARWLVTQLFSESYDLESVIVEIEQSRDLTGEMRIRAIKHAKTLKPAPQSWVAESQDVVAWSGAHQSVYEYAHRQITAAIQLGNQTPEAFEALATAEYRLGRYDEALQMLQKRDESGTDGRVQFTAAVAPLVYHKLGRTDEALHALAQTWGHADSRYLAMFGEAVVARYKRLFNESKRELLGQRATELESVLAPRVGQALLAGDAGEVDALLKTAPPEISAAREVIPYLIAEFIVRQRAERVLSTARLSNDFEDDSQLPESVREIAVTMAGHAAPEVQLLYSRCIHTLITPGLTDDQYRLASQQANDLLDLIKFMPRGSYPIGALTAARGFGEYRTGQFEAAIETLKQAEGMEINLPGFTPTFLAMAYHRTGDSESLPEYTAKIKELREHLDANPSEDLQPLVAEAERLLSIQSTSPEIQGALFDAVLAGDVTRIHDLIKAGADVNRMDTRDKTAGPNGRRCLNYAAIRNDIPMIKALLGVGANLGLGNRTGFQPLHHAAETGSTDAATLLIERGADLTSRTHRGLTPLMIAEANGHEKTAAALRRAIGE